MEKVEHLILENLIGNEQFARHVLPHLKQEYFEDRVESTLFDFITKFFTKHNKLPTKRILSLIAKEYTKFSDTDYSQAIETIDNLAEPDENTEYLIERTEKFCQDRAIYIALSKSINIADGVDTSAPTTAIPQILQDALSVSFDKNVGHDYINDMESRWDFYNKREDRIPWPWDIFNKITGGGVAKKTLNLFLMPPKTGKTLAMCDYASFCIRNGYKALYITLEMAEERIAERIDANLLDMSMKEVERLPKSAFLDKLSKSYAGNLVIKEFPTAGAHAGHFQALIDELKMKKNFVPDIIFIDYLNICASSRLKMGGSVNSYSYVKAVGEELRGLAIFNNVPIISATQTNREGAGSTDLSVENLSDSFGTAMTVDFMIAGMRNEDLDKRHQIMFSQLLSRYGDINYYRRFVLGIDLPHFRLFDVEDSAQEELSDRGRVEEEDDRPVFDRSRVGARMGAGSLDKVDFD